MELTLYQKIMKVTGLVYALMFIFTSAVFFIAFPDLLFAAINSVSKIIFPALPPAADSGKFWLSMTVSMMAGVTTASLMIFIDVKKYYPMAIPLCAMKFTSALAGISFFAAGFVYADRGWNTLANAVIFMTDFPLGIFIIYLYKKVRDGL